MKDTTYRSLAEDLKETEERLFFEVSKAERLLNFYTWGETPEDFPEDSIPEERVENMLKECSRGVESANTLLSFVNSLKNNFDTTERSAYDEEMPLHDTVDYLDDFPDTFAEGLPTGGVIDAIQYFEKIERLASEKGLDTGYNPKDRDVEFIDSGCSDIDYKPNTLFTE